MLTQKQLDKLKLDIITYLKNNEIFESTDITLIDQLISNIKLKQDAEKHIKKYGIVLNVRKNSESTPYFQQNPSIAIKNSAEKMISQLSSKLSLTPVERKKMKLVKGDEKEKNLLDYLNAN